MENASKALIIAGSILLSILIIALGMYIFSSSSTSSDLKQLSETEIQSHNGKFEKYNNEQLGSNVIALLNVVRANASTNKKNNERIPNVWYFSTKLENGKSYDKESDATKSAVGEDGFVADTYGSALTYMISDIEKTHRYTVKIEYNGESGLINKIKIEY